MQRAQERSPPAVSSSRIFSRVGEPKGHARAQDMEVYNIKEGMMPHLGYRQLEIGEKLLRKMGRIQEADVMAKRSKAARDSF